MVVESTPFRADRPAVELRDLTIQHPNAVEAVFDPEEQRKTVTGVFCDLCAPKCLNNFYKKVSPFYDSHRSCLCIPLCCKTKKKDDEKKDGDDKDGKGGGDKGAGKDGKGEYGKAKASDETEMTDEEKERGPCLVGASLEVNHGDLCVSSHAIRR